MNWRIYTVLASTNLQRIQLLCWCFLHFLIAFSLALQYKDHVGLYKLHLQYDKCRTQKVKSTFWKFLQRLKRITFHLAHFSFWIAFCWLEMSEQREEVKVSEQAAFVTSLSLDQQGSKTIAWIENFYSVRKEACKWFSPEVFCVVTIFCCCQTYKGRIWVSQKSLPGVTRESICCLQSWYSVDTIDMARSWVIK